MNGHSNILLTGASGILGSHILFELIQQYTEGVLTGKIVLIVRSGKNLSALQRLKEILQNPFVPEKMKSIPVAEALQHIVLIDSELHQFSREKLPVLPGGYTVIHAAASVNLGQGEAIKNELYRNNYLGTVHFINEILPVTQKFVFISTAYSSGHWSGMIFDDFFTRDDYHFRNPYEYFKHQTEIYVRDICSKRQVEWQILRPSIICGRLIEAPLYAISRFLVFYLFARYVINLRKRIGNHFIQLHVPKEASINIVPVDYVAKVVVVVMQETIMQLNIVHPKSVSCRTLFEKGFGLIDFNNYSFSENMPEPANPVERLLYSTIGQQLGPYIDTPAHSFDTAGLKAFCPEFNIPEIENNFCGLLTFAADRKFVELY
jgi:nucleoside-diphosphate-sugar epimerase